ncbi:MAG: NADP-dependent oxidoreductase [Nocardioidaceae bacterium]
MTRTREIRLAARPNGWPTADDFDMAEVELADPGPGQVLVRNSVMSVDPYMRGRMNDVPSYVPAYQLSEPLDGGAVGQVTESQSADVPVGSWVLHGLGWREHAVVAADRVRVVDTEAAPDTAYLSVLGMTGMTAYTGLVAIASIREGDIVFVSGAAGAVGSTAVQMARLLGASRVIGSAGSAEKVNWVRDDLGADAAFDHHAGNAADLLAEAAPKGVDVYFDNVGGAQLEAAIGALRRDGRIALCGAISGYNATSAPPGPRNLALLIGKRGRLQGFIVSDHEQLRERFTADVTRWLTQGRVVSRETIVHGLDHAVDGFIGLLRGDNIGKMVIRL